MGPAAAVARARRCASDTACERSVLPLRPAVGFVRLTPGTAEWQASQRGHYRAGFPPDAAVCLGAFEKGGFGCLRSRARSSVVGDPRVFPLGRGTEDILAPNFSPGRPRLPAPRAELRAFKVKGAYLTFLFRPQGGGLRRSGAGPLRPLLFRRLWLGGGGCHVFQTSQGCEGGLGLQLLSWSNPPSSHGSARASRRRDGVVPPGCPREEAAERNKNGFLGGSPPSRSVSRSRPWAGLGGCHFVDPESEEVPAYPPRPNPGPPPGSRATGPRKEGVDRVSQGDGSLSWAL